MKTRKTKRAVTVTMAVIAGLGATSALAADRVVATSVKTLNGQKYTFQKLIGANGNVYSRILLDGIVVSSEPRVARSLLDPNLKARLATLTDGQVVKVNVALVGVGSRFAETSQSGGITVKEGRVTELEQNGKPISEEELAAQDKRLADALIRDRLGRQQAQSAKLLAFAQRYGVALDAAVRSAMARGSATVTLNLTGAQVRRMIAAKDADLAGLELYFPTKDVIGTAMIDTNVSAWAHTHPNGRGTGTGIYMTESGCADEAGRPNYDRLAGSQTNHSQNVFGILRAVSPNSYIYCRGSAVLPQNSDIDGVGGNPPIHVINRSNGGNYTINYSTLDRDWDNFAYDNRIAIFNAAGNEGGASGTVISPAKGINVVAVGNYNDATDAINSGSSFVDPETNSEKPEISAPGTNITAGGFTMTGTSMASPHAAGMAADLLSMYPFYRLRPHLTSAVMVGGATDPIAGGFEKVGTGGIDFLSAAYNGWHYYYQGGNGAYNAFDAGDGATNNYIEKRLTISNSWNKVRVAIAWVNRGEYTYSHRADAHPIGQDMDLYVYGPTGALVGASASWDNPFESVNFVPATTGIYTIKIRRYANRDTAGAFRMGLLVNTYN
jgi:hypothetical protein